MRFLKQSTATTVVIGPFVDETDQKTPETTLDLSTADYAELFKHNSGTTVDFSGVTATAVTGANGMYSIPLTASHTDTLGQLTLYIADTSLCLPRVEHFQVLPANVYDSLFGSDLLQVDLAQVNNAVAASAFVNSNSDGFNADVTRISTSSAAADNLEAGGLGVVQGECGTGSTLTSIITTLTEATSDHYNGRKIVFITGALAGQAADITDYSGTTKTLTVSQLTSAPVSGDDFVIV
jgi:hypothetical protein